MQMCCGSSSGVPERTALRTNMKNRVQVSSALRPPCSIRKAFPSPRFRHRAGQERSISVESDPRCTPRHSVFPASLRAAQPEPQLMSRAWNTPLGTLRGNPIPLRLSADVFWSRGLVETEEPHGGFPQHLVPVTGIGDEPLDKFEYETVVDPLGSP